MLIMMMKMMKHCWYNPLLNEDVQINIFDKNKMMHFQGCTNNKKRNSLIYSNQEFEFCLSKCRFEVEFPFEWAVKLS